MPWSAIDSTIAVSTASGHKAWIRTWDGVSMLTDIASETTAAFVAAYTDSPGTGPWADSDAVIDHVAPGRTERVDRGPGAPHDAEQVDLDQRPGLLVGQLHQVAVVAHPGVVEPRGERAEALGHLGDLAMTVRVTHVLRQALRRADLLGGTPGGVAVDVGHDHAMAPGHHPLGDTAADAARRSGDHHAGAQVVGRTVRRAALVMRGAYGRTRTRDTPFEHLFELQALGALPWGTPASRRHLTMAKIRGKHDNVAELPDGAARRHRAHPASAAGARRTSRTPSRSAATRPACARSARPSG